MGCQWLGILISQPPATHSKKGLSSVRPPDLIKEFSRFLDGGADALPDKTQVPFHVFHLQPFLRTRGLGGFPEGFDVVQNVFSRGIPDRHPLQTMADLVEQPGVADAPPANHETRRSGDFENFEGALDRVGISIRQDGVGEMPCGRMNQGIVHDGLVHFGNRPSMNGQQVQAVFGENIQQLREPLRRIKSNPGFDGEQSVVFTGDIPQDTKQGVDAIQVTEQSAPGALAVNHRSRTAKVEVDGCNRIPHQSAGGAAHGVGIVADQLGDSGAAGRVLNQTFQDPFLGFPSRGYPKEFRPINIRTPVPGEDSPKCQVGDLLHGGQGQQRAVPLKERPQSV